METHDRRCKLFLRENGWKYDPVCRNGSGAFINGEHVAVDFYQGEIVLLDDTGDFLHLPINYYALVGALMEYRQITVSYKSV